MRNKKNTLHTESLENLLTGYKQAYSRHKHWHTQLLKVLVTSKTPQDKIFDVLNIVATIEVEDATETGKSLA